MTLHHLRVLVSVAEAGSVRGAADTLVVSQPAVSAALAALRRELGVPLVAREGRGLRLTPAGEIFTRYARRVLGLLDEGIAAAAGHLHPERGRVRLAAVTTVGEHVLPAFVAAFRRRFPEAELALEVGNRQRVWQLLTERRVDLAIGGRPPAGGALTTVATRPHRLVVLGSADAVAAAAGNPAGQVWLLREEGSGTRAATEELLGELSLTPGTLTIGSNVAIRETVAAGVGVALLSGDAVARELAEGTLAVVPGQAFTRERAWCVVTRAGEELPGPARLFVDHLCRRGRGRVPRPFHRTGDETAAGSP